MEEERQPLPSIARRVHLVWHFDETLHLHSCRLQRIEIGLMRSVTARERHLEPVTFNRIGVFSLIQIRAFVLRTAHRDSWTQTCPRS
jgi:hypothetical protein